MAARGNSIIITATPRGKKETIIVSGTPKPGTVMEIQTAFYQGNRHLMRAYQPGTDGERRVIAVLLEATHRGGLVTDAYVSGEVGEVYYPLPGEELNMLLADVSGTGDTHPVLGTYIVDTGTGKLIKTTGSPESEPFQLLTAQSALTEDTLAPCMFTGY